MNRNQNVTVLTANPVDRAGVFVVVIVCSKYSMSQKICILRSQLTTSLGLFENFGGARLLQEATVVDRKSTTNTSAHLLYIEPFHFSSYSGGGCCPRRLSPFSILFSPSAATTRACSLHWISYLAAPRPPVEVHDIMYVVLVRVPLLSRGQRCRGVEIKRSGSSSLLLTSERHMGRAS